VFAAGGLASADEAKSPSKLDYLVLASFVNSPHLLSMASYRSTANQGTFMSDGKIPPNRKAAAGDPVAGVPAAGTPAAGAPRDGLSPPRIVRP
jgi:hypothetical protein